MGIQSDHLETWRRLPLTLTPTDEETLAVLNREGAQGWELVTAVCAGIAQPTLLYFKRPR